MKNKITTIIVFFISLSCFSQSISITPSVINVSGGNSQKGYYQFEWSVGEMSLINEMESRPNKLVVTNGFLQSYLLNPGTNNTDHQFGADEIRVFPNPASNYVEINFFTRQQGRLRIGFYDGLGQKISSLELRTYGIDLIQKIPVSLLPEGTYVLRIELDADMGYVSKKGIYKIIKID
jgi:Secretion system C-terminal sorting domain